MPTLALAAAAKRCRLMGLQAAAELPHGTDVLLQRVADGQPRRHGLLLQTEGWEGRCQALAAPGRCCGHGVLPCIRRVWDQEVDCSTLPFGGGWGCRQRRAAWGRGQINGRRVRARGGRMDLTCCCDAGRGRTAKAAWVLLQTGAASTGIGWL